MLETQIRLVDPPCSVANVLRTIRTYNQSRWSLALIGVVVHLVAASKGVCCFSCCSYCCCLYTRPIR